MKHNIKVDLNCLDPGNVHLNNLNAPVLNVLRWNLGKNKLFFLSSEPYGSNTVHGLR